MSWLEKILPKSKITAPRRHNIPEGVWTKCSACEQVLYRAELERNLEVCPKCDHHMRISARARLESFLDEQGRTEIGAELEPQDVLKFKDSKRYKDRLSAAQKETAEKDALVVMKGTLKGVPVVACSFEFSFMGGSMASVVGARFVRAVEECIKEGRGLVCFSASGGARMQEALFSLMQMAKTSAALDRLTKAGLPYISVLTDPTMGGVSASLAMLGDINVGEPKALIGFAGPRVIEQTVREKLPEGFQRSEFLLEKGAIDIIIDRREMRNRLASLLAKMLNTSRHRRVKMSSNMQQSQSRSLVDWLSYLEQIHPVNIDMGLDRVGAVARRMGLTQLPFKVITVAGTNGKGSSCAMAASILMAAGYKVGVYSSPHLLRFTERVRVNGQELPDSDHCAAFAEVEAARGEIALTFFEFATPGWLVALLPRRPRCAAAGSGTGRSARRHQCGGVRCGDDHLHCPRSLRLAGGYPRSSGGGEGWRLSRRQTRHQWRAQSASDYCKRSTASWRPTCVRSVSIFVAMSTRAVGIITASTSGGICQNRRCR